MRRVRATARLTDRYFYEGFADREALLAAAWDSLRQDTIATILAATFDERDRTAGERSEVAIGHRRLPHAAARAAGRGDRGDHG